MDRGGVLQVGPESAGADPGPAAYGRGGDRPTVTDANVVLGRLDPQAQLGTEEGFYLDVAAAESAIRKRISEPLELSVTDAALSILQVANVKMAGAIRRVSVDRGHDPRKFALVGFGGAGPAHIVELAVEIGSTRVLIPPQPGITSALGCLLSMSPVFDQGFELDRVRSIRVDEAGRLLVLGENLNHLLKRRC